MLQLQNFGFFDLILPFLLLFAIVFGILSYMKIFGNQKSIHVIIALVLALLAIRFPVFTDFLNLISPRLGIGLVILLVLLILIGLFTPDGSQGTIGWIFIGVAVIIAIVIFAQVYDIMQFGGGLGYGSDLIGGIIIIALLIGVIVAVVMGGGSDKPTGTTSTTAKKLKALFGD